MFLKRVALATALLLAPVFWALSGQTETGTLSGTVTAEGTSQPLSGVTVSLSVLGTTSTGPEYETTTDGNGRFVIGGLPSNRYQLRAERDGYVAPSSTDGLLAMVSDVVRRTLGAAQSASMSTAPYASAAVAVVAGQRTEVSLTLRPTATISGRVLRTDGQPMEDVEIEVFRIQYPAGRAVMDRLRMSGFRMSVSTDDRGAYRAPGLVPGEYYVRAVGRPDAPGDFVSTYLGDTPNPGTALPVTVSGPVETVVADIRMQAEPTFTISGRALNPMAAPGDAFGEVAEVVLVRLDPGGPEEPAESHENLAADPTDGSFLVDRVRAGDYNLFAVFRDPGGDPVVGTTRVGVGSEDVTAVDLLVRPYVDVPGQFVFEGNGAIPPYLSVTLEPLETVPYLGDWSRVDVAEDGTFAVPAVPEGRYRITVEGLIQSGRYVRDIRAGGRSLLNDGVLTLGDIPGRSPLIEVTLGTGISSVSGTVANTPTQAVTVVLIPEPPLRDNVGLYREATTDASGRYRFTGLVPGTYRVMAFDRLPGGAHMSRRFMAGYDRFGQLVTVDPAADTAAPEIEPIMTGVR